MIRIRFHGRGGHGVKTAGRVAGAAAFLSGLHAQDSPIYGAERRGAAVASYTRIDQLPIRERGVIARPDLVVLADETLLHDASAGVLQGVASHATVFVNTEHPDQLALPEGFSARLITLDVTRRTLETLGRASALSAGLGAIAARLSGVIPRDRLLEAIHQELASLHVSSHELDLNQKLASDLFDAIPAIESLSGAISSTLPAASFAANPSPTTTSAPHDVALPEPPLMATISYEGAVRGAPSVLAPGNSVARMTGAWRVERPVVDTSLCTRCGLCFVQCPDGAVALDANGYPVIDYDHCKGCLICGRICPARAIHRERETQAW